MHVRSLGRIAVIALFGLSLACHSRGGIIHRVEEGESLTLIAHVYEVPIRELLAANPRVTSDELRPGEKILVPGATEKRKAAPVVWDLEEVKTATREDPEEKGTLVVAEEIAEPAPSPGATPVPAPTVVGPVPPMIAVKPPVKSRTVKIAPKKVLGFSWPATGAVISKFGMRNRKMHNGIDIRTSPGGDILSVADGKVVYVGTDVEGYGRLLIVRHPTNLFSVYAYLGRILVVKGAVVARGAVVAKANSKPSEAFFHFELRRGKRAIDPLAVLPK